MFASVNGLPDSPWCSNNTPLTITTNSNLKVGELTEIFQWKGEVENTTTTTTTTNNRNSDNNKNTKYGFGGYVQQGPGGSGYVQQGSGGYGGGGGGYGGGYRQQGPGISYGGGHLPSPPSAAHNGFSPHATLEAIRARQAAFSAERDWAQFHTPRNLVLALVGEVGELAEIFQWKGEVQPKLPGWSAAEREHLGEELSDVLLYLVRLSDVCGVDLPAACEAKLAKNARKYPADLCRGSARKYTEYKGEAGGAADADSKRRKTSE
eukprot:CAMPEP_0179925202 /NCGR_PEP_ID=MMETSP0983-20121128/7127_1 /TAXON_ID=483367 /ORGANISM="non described non described, Strain CCMP 2436" /LENGTH=263 /DNA_ID=CAMNT_0021828761 /DNA_START=159 /DNA_END=951 /DNA_ORIENTATION=+